MIPKASPCVAGQKRPVTEVLAERRATVMESTRTTDTTTRAMLEADIVRLDAELKTYQLTSPAVVRITPENGDTLIAGSWDGIPVVLHAWNSDTGPRYAWFCVTCSRGGFGLGAREQAVRNGEAHHAGHERAQAWAVRLGRAEVIP